MNGINSKILNVTDDRQVTIPLVFFEELHFGKKAECFVANDAVIIRPFETANDNFNDVFTIDILKDLISQGYNGNELVEKFEEQHINIKKAIGVLISESDEIAAGNLKSVSTEDIFGEI
ncbi:MAG: AbrB/MazE/SpoVT family DNA-binding domain-containing protein [Oscillospiraceae bacterium]|nr:AbrB/MazE/SpoVT family DNA-binding domain-containing protein [Oscillospiraceae bacterium]